MKKSDKSTNITEFSVNELTGYILGILGIVLAFFQPLYALVISIIGFIQVKEGKTEIQRKAKKFNIIAMVISIVMIFALILVGYYLDQSGLLMA